MYGSSLMLVTRMLRDSRIAAREAAAMPFPREETTPPVTNTYFVIYPRRVGMEEFTRIRAPSQMSGRPDASDYCRCKSVKASLRGRIGLRGGDRAARLGGDAGFHREMAREPRPRAVHGDV